MERGAVVWARWNGDWRLATVSKREPHARSVLTKFTLELHAGREREKGKGKSGQEGKVVLETEVDEQTGEPELVKLANIDQRLLESHSLQQRSTADCPASESIDDLTVLPHLNEPSILHTLQQRFSQDIIYTNTGAILIAVNPFKNLSIYSLAHADQYLRHGSRVALGFTSSGCSSPSSLQAEDRTEALEPHVFKLADQVFRAMAFPSQHPGRKVDQSILISGESGAGKTMTTKFVMQYLTLAGARDSCYQRVQERSSKIDGASSSTSTIEERVLGSNPVLESFGNARTTRNDNSSRFGKFIQLRFNDKNRLVGGKIFTYLLEKVRVVQQGAEERNYHIFYEMIAGASADEYSRWHLQPAQAFNYLNKGTCLRRKDGVDDAECFRKTCSALGTVGFDECERDEIFSILSGILQLGNLTFATTQTPHGQEEHVAVDNSSMDYLVRASSLLGFSSNALERALCSRHIMVGNEKILKALTLAEAQNACNALAKAVYSKLFSYINWRINQSFASGVGSSGGKFIGVLDIFGFESFKTNSFEQLCINYANESLQQQFNRSVFRLEQEEYERERIKWSFIDFPDNKDCIELIAGSGRNVIGILSILDEECLFPKGSDASFANKAYDRFKDHRRFRVSNSQRPRKLFAVKHYAGEVCYDSAGFLEKNKDMLFQAGVDLAENSKCKILKAAFYEGTLAHAGEDLAEKLKPARGALTNRARGCVKRRSAICLTTLGTQFKEQLADLIGIIDATEPHYVRCIKPSDTNQPNEFDRSRVCCQLSCGGVLEAVKVARAGYPVRMTYEQFFSRYRQLFRRPKGDAASRSRFLVSELQSLSKAEIPRLLFHPRNQLVALGLSSLDNVQLGVSKVFFRQRSYEIMERAANLETEALLLPLKAVITGWITRWRLRRQRKSAVRIQALWRMYRSRQRYHHLRREVQSAIRIQAMIRAFLCQRRLRRHRRCIIRIQSFMRRVQAQKAFQNLRVGVRAVVSMQSLYRRWQAVKTVQMMSKLHKEASNDARDSALSTVIAEDSDSFPSSLGQASFCVPPVTDSEIMVYDELEKLRYSSYAGSGAAEELLDVLASETESSLVPRMEDIPIITPKIQMVTPIPDDLRNFQLDGPDPSLQADYRVTSLPKKSVAELHDPFRSPSTSSSKSRASVSSAFSTSSKTSVDSLSSLSTIPRSIFSFHDRGHTSIRRHRNLTKVPPQAIEQAITISQYADVYSVPNQDFHNGPISVGSFSDVEGPSPEREYRSPQRTASSPSTMSAWAIDGEGQPIAALTDRKSPKNQDCDNCGKKFKLFRRKYICRTCGDTLCRKCIARTLTSYKDEMTCVRCHSSGVTSLEEQGYQSIVHAAVHGQSPRRVGRPTIAGF